MRKLCLVSCILSRAHDYVNDIPQQRLVFFVQHLVGQLETSVSSLTVAGGQIMVVLSFVLPALKEIYGPFWSAVLDQIQNIGIGTQADLFALHASLKLLNLIRRPYMLESNDDLLDAWSEKKTVVAKCLVDLLRQLQGKSPAFFGRIEEFGFCDGYTSSFRSHLSLSILWNFTFADDMVFLQVTQMTRINHGESSTDC